MLSIAISQFAGQVKNKESNTTHQRRQTTQRSQIQPHIDWQTANPRPTRPIQQNSNDYKNPTHSLQTKRSPLPISLR
jgi:hypothetical protein